VTLRRDIAAVSFDVANSVEDVQTGSESQLQAAEQLSDLLRKAGHAPPQDAASFREALLERYRKYHARRLVTHREEPISDFWSRHILPDVDEAIVGEHLDRLTEIWLYTWHRRTVIDGAAGALRALRGAGIRLACIANTISGAATRSSLQRMGLENLDSVVLSEEVGLRKPHEKLFLQAASELDIPRAQICHVGDQLARDVVGSIAAGYGMSVLIGDRSSGSWHDSRAIWPDASIGSIRELPSLLLGTPER
jgi:FMN phosphatase YigB (HAD superfamily)